MTNAVITGGAVGVYVAMVNAIKASGAIIHVESDAFTEIVSRNHEPLVVHSPSTLFSKNQYLTAYKGLIFYTKSAAPLALPHHVETIHCKRIWIPT